MLCLTVRDRICPSNSYVCGISQARIPERVAVPSSGDLPDSGIEPALAGGFSTTEPPGSPCTPRGKATWEHSMRVSGGTNAGTWNSDFQPPGL